MGILSNVTNPSNVLQRREVEAAAGKSGVSMATIDVRTVDEIGTAIQTFVRERASILVVLASPSLKALDPEWPIREADMSSSLLLRCTGLTCYT